MILWHFHFYFFELLLLLICPKTFLGIDEMWITMFIIYILRNIFIMVILSTSVRNTWGMTTYNFHIDLEMCEIQQIIDKSVFCKQYLYHSVCSFPEIFRYLKAKWERFLFIMWQLTCVLFYPWSYPVCNITPGLSCWIRWIWSSRDLRPVSWLLQIGAVSHWMGLHLDHRGYLYCSRRGFNIMVYKTAQRNFLISKKKHLVFPHSLIYQSIIIIIIQQILL